MKAKSFQGVAANLPQRLYHQNLSFLRRPYLKVLFKALGCDLRFGLPRSAADGVVIWGASPTAYRGERAALKTGARLIRLEDAFLRSVKLGRMGEPPLGLLIDPDGVHFDASTPSYLDQILQHHPLDDSHLLTRARHGIARLRRHDLSKYNNHDPQLAPPDPGYVLIVDQVKDDASLRASGADQALFEQMLDAAREHHPHARIIIKTHPESQLGLRKGHYTTQHCDARTTLYDSALSPWAILEGAIAVYTISSQLGFEAILAGHRPHVWGTPFYAGWGLSEDHSPLPSRGRSLTRAQLFAGAMILAPTWFDHSRRRLCTFEEALNQLEAQTRAYREDRRSYIAVGMRLWKRRALQEFFGQAKALTFESQLTRAQSLAQTQHKPLLIWASHCPNPRPANARLCEDGFLRSKGLGANLIAPLSLVSDDLGMYYDPRSPSQLEKLLSQPMPDDARPRAQALAKQLRQFNISKYNLSQNPIILPAAAQEKTRILVPGQVEDDASIRLGADNISDNLGLLQATRAANPDAYVIWKPHPDVQSGLRKGAVSPQDAALYADLVLDQADITSLIEQVDAVWTMTSLTGFEALIRGKAVTTLGCPFYAGWGLTTDLGTIPIRRLRHSNGAYLARPDLDHLIYASLIAYPRYFDPISKRACPPELIIERLRLDQIPKPGIGNRGLAKLQGIFASYAWLWR